MLKATTKQKKKEISPQNQFNTMVSTGFPWDQKKDRYLQHISKEFKKKLLVDIKSNMFEEFCCQNLDGVAKLPEKCSRHQEQETVLKTLFNIILDKIIVHVKI